MIDEQPVGVLALEERPTELFLALIEILPSHQGQGLGSAVISDVQRRAAARGLPLTLRVLRVNPAQRLYQRLGFVLSAETVTHLFLVWHPPP
jgi:GNAT superfamily N-acetyltransferase